ncbi:RNA-binding protein 48 isoform X3 [Dromiciops gliroides]|uniref:RNA-binding protein 48 isoform X3 n=1 Tax=Dromiciops gliroides TaxID=33562 RepID=UPI001CC3F9E7|nr:RNA-binding protein 48 isoform X3 [Dromiciops gliroides]
MEDGGGELGGYYPHHAQRAVCDSRAKYREGRRPRAVKVYTVNLESRYLLIQGVPAVGVMKELVEQFALFGAIEQYNALDEYPAEEFTEVYLIKFQKLQSARVAKRKLDERSFFGGLLHVCYAPEFETVQETREKLQERRRYIARATGIKEDKVQPLTKKGLYTEHKVTRDLRNDLQSKASEFCATPSNTCTENPWNCLPNSRNSAACHVSSKYATSQSGEFLEGTLVSPQHDRNYNQTMSSCNQNNSLIQSVELQLPKTSVDYPGPPRIIPSNNGIARFMPRTTQLQERKRRREEDRILGTFLETNPRNKEVIIGPQLPEIPKVDMEDESLNMSANLIRNKLKEVISSQPKPSEEKLENTHISRPLKQRRRI